MFYDIWRAMLFCEAQWCTVKQSAVQHSTVLWSTVLYCEAWCCTVKHSAVLWSTVLYCEAQCCIVKHSAVLWSTVLQREMLIWLWSVAYWGWHVLIALQGCDHETGSRNLWCHILQYLIGICFTPSCRTSTDLLRPLTNEKPGFFHSQPMRS